jgi:predicted ArsR family transcriptional regulator
MSSLGDAAMSATSDDQECIMETTGVFGERRKRLLRHLLKYETGASVGELAQVLGVTRTAVRQHLETLRREGLVEPRGTRASRGRPNRLFALTPAGHEALPRHYSWFAQLLVEAIVEEHGTAGLRTRLGRIAAAVVNELEQNAPRAAGATERIEQLAAVMDEVGYDATTVRDENGVPVIEADNCVFHELAIKQPEVCQFDLALLSGYTGAAVELHECMARGGHVCRFRFSPRH